jgi:uridine phosphorylase
MSGEVFDFGIELNTVGLKNREEGASWLEIGLDLDGDQEKWATIELLIQRFGMNPSYPILEYDLEREAVIEPMHIIQPRDIPEHCVLCFFKEVVENVAKEYHARVAVENRWEDGPHPIYEIEYAGQRLAFFHPGVGAPLAVGLLEEAIAYGCRKFIACGGCGVLERGTTVGNLIVVSGAVRDEGTSYHYLPPGREVAAHPIGVAALELVLSEGRFPFKTGKTWTTDAPYRETRQRIVRRIRQGCVAVEMEAAGLMAAAQHRQVVLGQILYAGDDLSGSEWDHRSWQSRADIRERLFWLSAQACLRL